MGRVPDLGSDRQTLQFWRQDIEHGSARDESRCAQGNFEFVRSTIVISDGLVLAAGHLHRVKCSDLGRREIIQSSVDVPSVEASVTLRRVLRGDLGLVETRMLGVLQLGFSQTFVIVNGTVADKLNLRNSRDSLEVRVEDRFAVFLGFVVAVTVGIALRVESLTGEGRRMSIRSRVLRYLTYFRKAVLFLWQEINISEEQRIVLHGTSISKAGYGISGGSTNLVQQLLDLFEFLVRQSSWVDTPDLSSEVFELGRVGSRWKGKRDGFYGHDCFPGRRCPRVSREIRSSRTRSFVLPPQHEWVNVLTRPLPAHTGGGIFQFNPAHQTALFVRTYHNETTTNLY